MNISFENILSTMRGESVPCDNYFICCNCCYYRDNDGEIYQLSGSNDHRFYSTCDEEREYLQDKTAYIVTEETAIRIAREMCLEDLYLEDDVWPENDDIFYTDPLLDSLCDKALEDFCEKDLGDAPLLAMAEQQADHDDTGVTLGELLRNIRERM